MKTIAGIMGILCFAVFLLPAKAQNYRFSKITSNEGLSQSEVYSFIKDRHGFIWIGTLDGLNRFDGYKITRFNVSPDQRNSLSNNTIHALAEDRTGRIWIGTDNGLNMLSPDNQNIIQIELPVTTSKFIKVFHLFTDQSFLWISTNIGLFLAEIDSDNLQEVTRSIKQIKSIGASVIENKYVYRTIKLSNGVYCCGLSYSIETFYFDPQKKVLKPVFLSNELKVKGASHMIEDRNGNFWFSNINIPEYGLYRLNIDRAELSHFNKGNHPLSSNRISAMVVDTTGNLWLGTTDHGLMRIRAEQTLQREPIIEYFKNDIFDLKSINSNLIYSLYASSDNQLWIGTIGSGVNYLHLKQRKFNHYLIPPLTNEKTDRNNFIRSVFLDKNNNLWIGTHNNGLFILNRTSGVYRKIGFNSQIIFHIDWFDNNTMFVCTSIGAFLVQHDGKTTPVNEINRACFFSRKVSENVIFVGGILGLYRIEFNKKRITRLDRYDSYSSGIKLSYDNCRVLHHDKIRNELWVGTEGGGLNIVSLNSQFIPVKYTWYKKGQHNISSNYIRSITQTNEHTFWLGSHLGLIRCILENGKLQFKTFYTSDGLPNNMIQSIQYDKKNTLWLGSNSGLTQFNLLNNRMVSYSLTDGLQSNEFSEHTSYRAENGELFFGGINGVNSFFPEQIVTRNLNPEVTITDFYLFNNKINPQTEIMGRVLLDKPIFMTEQIHLKPKENNFRFEFSSMNFQSAAKIKYAYLLDGFDQNWNVTERGHHTATYTNLPHGNYVLRIKATNEDDEWSDSEKTIHISIATPFYLTWFAFLFYLIAAVSVIFYFTRYSVIKIATKKQIILDAEHNQRLHELDIIRTRFFVNISHDLRTPLTLITGPLEKVLKTTDYSEPLRNQLNMVYKNASKLKYLIEQLLDFRKVEVGKLIANFRKVELNEFVKNESDHFDFIIKDKGLDLIYDFRQESLTASIDTEKTAKVIFNLLSNALKFTRNGYIEIGVDSCEMGIPQKQYAKIWVKDTGCGIAKEKIERIFDRFYNDSQSTSDSSYGIGLSHCKDLIEVMNGEITVASTPGNGSTFTFYLPLQAESENLSDSGLTAIVHPDDLPNEELLIEKTQLESADKEQNIAKKHTLLIVEDNPEMREYIKSCLSENYRILEAEHGADGFELAKKKMPDLIISDLVMPIMDGIEFCEKIKSTLETSHIPVILLTARTDNEIKYKGLETGADDYISKPFDADYLFIKIKSLIKNRDQLRQLFRNNIQFEPSKITVTSTDEKFLKELMSEVEKGIPDSEFSVDSLEKAMAMSHAKFYNKIKSLTGLSGKALLQDFRLKRAAQIITDNPVSVADVCYMVGFSDPKYFSACFKQKFGVTPTDYRVKSREQSW